MIARWRADASARTLLALVLSAAATPVVAQDVSVQAAVERAEVYVGEPFRFRIAGVGQRPGRRTEPRSGRRFLGACSKRRTEQQRDRQHHQRPYHAPRETGATCSTTSSPPSLPASLPSRHSPCRWRERNRLPGQSAFGHARRSRSRTTACSSRWTGSRYGSASRCCSPLPGCGTPSWGRNGCTASATRCWTALHKPGVSATSIGHPPATVATPVRLPVAGRDVLWQRGQTRIDGERFASLSFATTLLPEHPGQLHVGSATVVFEGGCRLPHRARLLRDATCGNRCGSGSWCRPTSCTSGSRRCRSRGAPRTFSGLVGRFEIAARAAPLEVKVGDPMELTVTVTGSGDLRRLQVP